MLLDSNIIIYASKVPYFKLRSWLHSQSYCICALSGQEVMSYSLSRYEHKMIEQIFAQAKIVALTPSLLDQARRLQQSYGLSAVDAVIAATAMDMNIPLCTANTKDFSCVKGLLRTTIDPELFNTTHVDSTTTGLIG